MSKESYVRGFCKAAEARGIDPQALAKYAQSITGYVAPYMVSPKTSPGTGIVGSFMDYIRGVRDRWSQMNKAKAEYEKREAFLRGYDKAEPAWVSYTIGPGARGPYRPAKGAVIQPWYKERNYDPSMRELENDFKEWNQKRNEVLESYGREPNSGIELIDKRYPDELKRITGASPAQVSAPAKN